MSTGALLDAFEALPNLFQGLISIAHPETGKEYLTLGVYDVDGFPARLALEACYIVTGGTQGYLSLSSQIGSQSTTETNLPSGAYFYHADTRDYLVLQSFEDWMPPPTAVAIPDSWQTGRPQWAPAAMSSATGNSTNLANQVKTVDPFCVISHESHIRNAAHIVPKHCEEWYDRHNIVTKLTPARVVPFNVSDNTTNDVRNAVAIESGIHNVFDHPYMTFVPAGNAYMAFFLSPSECSQAARFHRRKAKMPDRIPDYLLYLRFAWTVFNFMAVTKRTKRRKVAAKASVGVPTGSSSFPVKVNKTLPRSSQAPKRSIQGSSISEHSENSSSASESEFDSDCYLERYPEISTVLDLADRPRVLELIREYKAEHPQVSETVSAERITEPDEDVKPMTKKEIIEMIVGGSCDHWDGLE